MSLETVYYWLARGLWAEMQGARVHHFFLTKAKSNRAAVARWEIHF